jgi:hypothetical protein
MPSTMKKQNGGGCGARNNTKKMNGGGAGVAANNISKMKGAGCGARNNSQKMTGGASKSKSKSKYGPNEGWCMNCGRADKSKGRVTMVSPKDTTKKTKKRTMKMRIGTCPNCGGKVYKIVGN